MPIVEIHVIEGYSPEAKARMAQSVTNAVRSVVPADPSLVTLLIHDRPPTATFVGVFPALQPRKNLTPQGLSAPF